LCCFSTSNTEGKRYRLSPETFGYILVKRLITHKITARQTKCESL